MSYSCSDFVCDVDMWAHEEQLWTPRSRDSESDALLDLNAVVTKAFSDRKLLLAAARELLVHCPASSAPMQQSIDKLREAVTQASVVLP